MPARVNAIHRIAGGVHVAIITEHTSWVRHEGIWREELAQFGVVVAGVVVLQAGAVALLAGEAVVGDDNVTSARAAIGIVALRSDDYSVLCSR